MYVQKRSKRGSKSGIIASAEIEGARARCFFQRGAGNCNTPYPTLRFNDAEQLATGGLSTGFDLTTLK